MSQGKEQTHKENTATVNVIEILSYVVGYIWYVSLGICIIPHLSILVSREIDRLLLVHMLEGNAYIIDSVLNNGIATIMGLSGLAMMLWAHFTLAAISDGFPFEIMTTKRSGSKKLCTAGPYAYTRNPMVCGYVLVLMGIGVYIGSVTMVFWVAPLLGITIATFAEYTEVPNLKKRFKEEYARYVKEVPLLVPRISAYKK